MLSVFDLNGEYPISGYSNFYITHVDGGEDTLDFSIRTDSAVYKHLAEENRIEYGDNYYLIKSIDAPSTLANVSCKIDLDFLRENFFHSYDSGSHTLKDLFTSLLPSGWLVEGYDPGISRTIKIDGATGYDVAKQAIDTYSVAYQWHTKEKRLTIINPNDTTSSGEYLTDELNLRSIAFKGESVDFVTRLYPYGKDGMTISTVNDGKEYIENHQYSDKIVCGYWSDERYTIPEDLKMDAEKRLRQLSAPVRSYDCDVIDLAKLNDKYSLFSFSMYKVVTLIDRRRKIRMDYQIMEYKECPDEPRNNVLTLSSVVPTIQDSVSQAQQAADDAQQGVAKAEIKIGQLEIDITGKVSFSDLSETGKTEINGNNIITGKIQSENGKVYFDLDGNEASVSKLVSATDEATDVYAYIGILNWAGGEQSKGMMLVSENGTFAIFSENYPDAFNQKGLDLATNGNISIRSNTISSETDNQIRMSEDSNQQGSIVINRANGSNTVPAFEAKSDVTVLHNPSGGNTLNAFPNQTDIHAGNMITLKSDAGNVEMYINSEGFEFSAGGTQIGRIDSTGWNGWVNGHLGDNYSTALRGSDGSVVHLKFEDGMLVEHSNTSS